MPRFAANLSTMFTELPILERVGAAAAVGFKAVEFQGPYEAGAETVAELAKAHGVEVVHLNAPWGPRPGDRGLAGVPGREDDFWADFNTALTYARAVGAPRFRVISGHAAEPAQLPGMQDVLVANLRRAAPVAAEVGVVLMLEPLNARDAPGYLVPDTATAVEIIDRIGAPNVSMQFDFYHLQMTDGDLAGHARLLFGRYDHVQISGNPGRHEPDVGEINYPYLFDLLDELGYVGWVGCEYKPAAGTVAGLGWARPYGIG
jgi:hydroxypyruvate isomerase